MLYWICPECGGECSPAIRECPACAGSPEISPASASSAYRKPQVTEEVLALAQNLQAFGRTPALATRLAADNGHSAQTATLELPVAPVEPVAQVALAPVEEVPVAVVPVEEKPPCAPAQEAIESLVRPLVESTILAPPPEPLPEALLEPLAPEVLSEAMALQAELVLESMAPPNIAEEQFAISGIVASYQKQPTVRLLPPDSVEDAAPAQVFIQWMRMPKPHILHVPQKNLNHQDSLSGPQKPPLAGPCVPEALRSLTEQHGLVHAKARKKAGLPAWTVSFVIALTLFLGVGSLLQYLGANREAKAAASTTPPSDASGSAVPAIVQPASKLVEVTGLRIAVNANRRPQLEFIVVNHSATALSGHRASNRRTRSASSNAGNAGTAPLFRVATTIASLGPYQSREFRAELDPGSSRH